MKKIWTKPSILKIENGSIKGGTPSAYMVYEAYVNIGYGTTNPCVTFTTPTAGGGVCTLFTATSFYVFTSGGNTAQFVACNAYASPVAFSACS